MERGNLPVITAKAPVAQSAGGICMAGGKSKDTSFCGLWPFDSSRRDLAFVLRGRDLVLETKKKLF